MGVCGGEEFFHHDRKKRHARLRDELGVCGVVGVRRQGSARET